MSDPRVVRGSTHSLARKITKAKMEMSKSQTIKMNKGPPESEQLPMSTYEFHVKPFSNDEMDVSKYLEQQNDYRPMQKALESQTDEFIPRPDTPDYIPAKVGVDIGTQVEDVLELFDFDKEVIPILEVIVQKTMEQALWELSSEEELASLEVAAKGFRLEKFQDDEWMRKREAQAITENAERMARIQALQVARENDIRTKTVIAGLQMVRQITPHSMELIFEQLYKDGSWRRTDEAVAEKDVVPQLLQKSKNLIDAHRTAEETLDLILMATEPLYQGYPALGPGPPRQMAIVLTFRRPPPDAPEGGDGEAPVVPSDDKDVTIMTVQISAKDSISSLNRRIRNEVYRLKGLAAAAAAAAAEGGAVEENNGAAAAAAEAAPSMNAVLPDATTLEPLVSLIYETLARSLQSPAELASGAPLRQIAHDGMLWNFPFPEELKIEMIVG